MVYYAPSSRERNEVAVTERIEADNKTHTNKKGDKKMSKQYTIDGRDPNAKGYVKENRMANQQETDKIVEALESFGYKNVEDYKFHLFGRLDDVHGWYLFGISKEDDEREDFLILGDCLDVLESPFNKVVDLDDVMCFARSEGIGENVGTAYDAMEEWGVFHGLSDEFCLMMDSMDVCIENERAFWDDKRKEWKLSYDVMFDTDMGGNECVIIKIPAQLGNSNEADREFFSEWKGECAAYKVGERYEDFLDDCEVTIDEAMQWAESKERAMYEIRRAISNFLEEGITPEDDDALAKSRERVEGEKVWVLTIYKDGQFFPEVHRTLEGAVQGAISDIAGHMEVDEVDEYPHDDIERELETQHYWKDEYKDVVYDIAECKVVA